MDIVAMLCDRVSKLPQGDFTVGLNAIIRHVTSAIRHLERDKSHDPDASTDAIYRTNQAYEGSLKEAYRVLATKDPTGLSTFEIEQYLESNNIVRPRVLTQLTRYRQDYRNPSTHDYKLDFDEDEALLAIVSVSAFACLLVNQIASKLASDEAVKASKIRSLPANQPLKKIAQRIVEICLSYTKASAGVDWFEYERGIAESLESAGVRIQQIDDPSKSFWDIHVIRNKDVFGIEIRVSSIDKNDNEFRGFSYLIGSLQRRECVAGLLILRSHHNVEYSVYKGETAGRTLYLICAEEDPAIKAMEEAFENFEVVSTRS